MPATAAPRQTARERLLAAADELFYEHGVQTVGIDRIIERAGVAKASLYNTFGSKDELVRAYLEARHQTRRDAIMATIAELTSPRDKVLAVFDRLATVFATTGWRGCAFINASAEAAPGSVVDQVAGEYRLWVRSLFRDLVAEAGASDPDALARELHLLYDGVGVAARMERDNSAAIVARKAAEALLDATLPR